jgi:hypothetical protein
MERKLYLVVIAALLLPLAAADAQSPPQAKPPLVPKQEMRDPDACAEAVCAENLVRIDRGRESPQLSGP